MSDPQVDLPPIGPIPPGQGLDDIARLLEQVRALLQAREPLVNTVGDVLGKYVTEQRLLDYGLTTQSSTGTIVGNPGGGGSPAPSPGPPGPPGPPPPPPDTTPPPALAGLTATPLFGAVFLQWTAPTYLQGGGNAQTNIYAATYSGSGPLPTFSNAVLVGSATGQTNVYVDPGQIGVTRHYWAEFVSKAGVKQPAPSGGTNGVAATIGLVGNVNLADGIIQARNLLNPLNGIYLNDDPVTRDASAWEWITGTPGAVIADASQPFGGSSLIGPATPTNSTVMHKRLIPIDVTNTYRLRVNAAKSGDSDRRMYLFVAFYNASGALLDATSNPAGWPFGGTYHYFGLVNQVPPSTAYTEYEVRFGVGETRGIPATARYLRIGALVHYQEAGGGTTGRNYFAAPRLSQVVRAQDIAAGAVVAGTIAAGAIVAGDGVIGNLAITNAMIANVSAAKLLAGSLAVGEYIQSTGYVPGSLGFRISGDGNAELSNAVVRGTINASAGSIGGIVIGSNYIQSTTWVNGSAGFRFGSDGTGQIGGITILSDAIQSFNFVSGSSGFRFKADGTAELAAASIRGQLVADQIAAINVQGDAVGSFTGITISGGIAPPQTHTVGTVSRTRTTSLIECSVNGFVTLFLKTSGWMGGLHYLHLYLKLRLHSGAGATLTTRQVLWRFQVRTQAGGGNQFMIPFTIGGLFRIDQPGQESYTGNVEVRLTIDDLSIRAPIEPAAGGPYVVLDAIDAAYFDYTTFMAERKV